MENNKCITLAISSVYKYTAMKKVLLMVVAFSILMNATCGSSLRNNGSNAGMLRGDVMRREGNPRDRDERIAKIRREMKAYPGSLEDYAKEKNQAAMVIVDERIRRLEESLRRGLQRLLLKETPYRKGSPK